jgi:hypothetical protein
VAKTSATTKSKSFCRVSSPSDSELSIYTMHGPPNRSVEIATAAGICSGCSFGERFSRKSRQYTPSALASCRRGKLEGPKPDSLGLDHTRLLATCSEIRWSVRIR